ncbi:hypothetical protein GGP62_002160 [Salinibacter ruber]|uniref:hypothetical protein n=1 Tax=Salinibacter ruber TaxID=146919 RepID=UPI0021699A5B|nr:hypothetical protein [Salinibacter ruber]MCS3707173.1 hypothetical protein [Salinibacter ruber]
MIQLPDNVTLAALALFLGILIGAGGTYYFTSSTQPSGSDLATIGEMEGQGVLERIRSIAPRDTSGQEEADVEIRYRTKRDTVRDSVYVPIPSTLSKPKLSDAAPISVTESKVTWTYWDPSARQFEQKLYAVPQDNFSLSAHVFARTYAPLRAPSLSLGRTWAGVGLSLRYRRLEATVGALTTPDLSDQRVSVGLKWEL